MDAPHEAGDGPDTPSLLDRRKAIGLGVTAAMAGMAVVAGADPASAATGGNFILGQANDAGANTTSLTANSSNSGVLHAINTDGATVSSEAMLAAFSGTGVSAQGSNVGVGASGGTTGVAADGIMGGDFTGSAFGLVARGGPHASPNSTAALGLAGGIGGFFGGNTANLSLAPGASTTPPNVAHYPGEIFVGSDVGILVCVEAGTPGIWVRLGFNPTAPTRVCDTRVGSGQPFAGQPIGPSQELVLPLVGVAPLPAAGVSAVVMNLTMANCNGDGWLTVYPNGQPRPNASNLNFTAGQSPKANLVVCGVGIGAGSTSPAVRIYNAAGTTNVVVDISGFYS